MPLQAEQRLMPRECWRVARLAAEGTTTEEIPIDPDTAPEAVGGLLADALDAQGYSGEPVLLALPSSQCLAAGVPIDSPAQLRQRQTLLYQLEQCLPLAAEDVVADFITHGQEVLGVAVETSLQQAVVGVLEDRGVNVQSISPLASWPFSTTVGFPIAPTLTWSFGETTSMSNYSVCGTEKSRHGRSCRRTVSRWPNGSPSRPLPTLSRLWSCRSIFRPTCWSGSRHCRMCRWKSPRTNPCSTPPWQPPGTCSRGRNASGSNCGGMPWVFGMRIGRSVAACAWWRSPPGCFSSP